MFCPVKFVFFKAKFNKHSLNNTQTRIALTAFLNLITEIKRKINRREVKVNSVF